MRSKVIKTIEDKHSYFKSDSVIKLGENDASLDRDLCVAVFFTIQT